MIWHEVPYNPTRHVLAAQAGQSHTHLLAGGGLSPKSWGGGWDILVAAPEKILTVKDGQAVVTGRETETIVMKDVMATLFKWHQSSADQAEVRDFPEPLKVPSFTSGLLGMIGYEMASLFEPSLALPLSPSSLPDLSFGLYQGCIAFHRGQKRCFVFAKTKSLFAQLAEIAAATSTPAAPPQLALSSSRTSSQYQDDVQSVIDAILEGEIFQANLSQKMIGRIPDKEDDIGWNEKAVGLFSAMTEESHAEFGACLQFETGCVASNSPERYFNIEKTNQGMKVMAEPVKGTRPRMADPKKDKAVADALLNNEKDRAENIMIADLVRNDLSRVCQDHSIREEKICELRSYTNVHHLVSQITGVLSSGKTALDVIATSFPCGSITGAPKMRAMEVIASLEKEGRGIYCGAIGFMNHDGISEFSIPIRTAVVEKAQTDCLITYGCGGGITVLSDPKAEHQETLDKAVGFVKYVDGAL